MPDLSAVINVRTELRSSQAPARRFGEGLIVTIDDRLPAGGTGKLLRLTRASEIATKLDAGSHSAVAAANWFSQRPSPAALQIIRWAHQDVGTTIIGGDPAASAAIRVAGLAFTIAGHDISVDASGDADLAAAAETVQTALRALNSGASPDARFDGCTFEYVTDHFELTLTNDDDVGPVTSTDGATDGATLLGLTAAAGASYRLGSDAETAADLINRAEELSDGFYYLMLDDSVPATVGTSRAVDVAQAFRARAALSRIFFLMASNASGALTAAESASDVAIASSEQSSRVGGFWDHMTKLEAVRAGGVLSSQDFRRPDSLLTAKFRTLVGQSAANLTREQQAELRRKRCNFYDSVGGSPILQEGQTFSPDFWIDARVWIDWLENELATEIFGLLTRVKKVPITNAGIAMYREALTNALERGVSNGGIATGVVSSELADEIRRVTGNFDFDGTLANGYLVHIASIADQVAYPQSSRDARDFPPTTIWVKYTSAFHGGDINLIFEG